MTGDASDLNISPTPSQQAAAAKLETLTANPEFRTKLLAGDGPSVKEFQDLVAAKLGEGDQVERLVAGTEPVPEISVTNGGVPIGASMRAAADLREHGVSDAAIMQLYKSHGVSPAELRDVKNLRADLLADKEFTTALLSGNREALRDLLHANIVIVGGAT